MPTMLLSLLGRLDLIMEARLQLLNPEKMCSILLEAFAVLQLTRHTMMMVCLDS